MENPKSQAELKTRTATQCSDCEKEPYDFWEPDNFYHTGFWTYGCDCEDKVGYGSTKERAKEDYERKTVD